MRPLNGRKTRQGRTERKLEISMISLVSVFLISEENVRWIHPSPAGGARSTPPLPKA